MGEDHQTRVDVIEVVLAKLMKTLVEAGIDLQQVRDLTLNEQQTNDPVLSEAYDVLTPPKFTPPRRHS